MKLEQNEKPLLFSETTIPDIFFAEHLSELPGDYLKIYLLKAKTLIDYINTNKSKSLSIKFLEKEGYKVTSYLGKPVHYLENIEKIFNF